MVSFDSKHISGNVPVAFSTSFPNMILSVYSAYFLLFCWMVLLLEKAVISWNKLSTDWWPIIIWWKTCSSLYKLLVNLNVYLFNDSSVKAKEFFLHNVDWILLTHFLFLRKLLTIYIFLFNARYWWSSPKLNLNIPLNMQ